MTVLVLSRYGEPTGQGRPRFVRATGHAHTPTLTASVANEWKAIWQANGRVRLPDGPIALTLVARFARPAGHYRRDGSLSKAGLETPHPTKRPDLSNLIKLVEDALNGLAYRDDAQIVHYDCRKTWATGTPGTAIVLRPAGVALPRHLAEGLAA